MEFGMEQESDITELPARSDLRLDNPTDLITDDEEIRQGQEAWTRLKKNRSWEDWKLVRFRRTLSELQSAWLCYFRYLER
jgi:hypothetical protein